MTKPRIAVVRVAMGAGRARDALFPPLFPIIAALSDPKLADVEFYDERLKPLPEIEADWICLSVETFAALHAYELAEHYRRAGKSVGIGGVHATLLPEEAAEHADTVFVGDAEGVWQDFLADVAAGDVQARYVCEHAAGFVDANSGLQLRGYPPLSVVQLSRGCRYGCEFCSVKAVYPGRVRCKTIAEAVRDVSACPHKLIFFADDNIFSDRAWARELFEALIPLKKRWACQISLDVAADPELLALMKKAGCFLVLIGFESLDPENLKAMRKNPNRAADYRKAVAAIYEQGLMIYATFVIGYDADTGETGDAIRAFCESCGFAVANFNPLSVYPGTPLHRRLSEQGRLTRPTWWLDPDYRYGMLAYTPHSATAAEIEESCRRARYEFYAPRSILRRLLRSPNRRAPLVYLAVNVISAWEIRRKQGLRLGTSNGGR